MSDDMEFEFAMDQALGDARRLIREIRDQLDSAHASLEVMARAHTQGHQVPMAVNAGGVIQGLGSQLDRQVGKLHVLVLAQRWR